MRRKRTSRTGVVKLRERRLKDGSGSLFLDIYHQGARRYEFLKLYVTGRKHEDRETLDLAEAIRFQREIELRAADWKVIPAHQKQRDAVAFFFKIADKRHKSWRAAAMHFEKFAGGPLPFSELTPPKVDAFRTYLTASLKGDSAWLYYGKFRSMLNEAIKQRIIVESPARFCLSISRKKSRPKFLTLEEVRALAATDCPNEVVGRAFLYAVFTGMAQCDLRLLTWGQLRDNILRYKRKKTQTDVQFALHEEAVAAAGPVGEDDALVFGNLPCSRFVGTVLVEWAQLAGVRTKMTFHVARHTFGTLNVSSGTDIYVVSKLMGHMKVTTTQIYAHVINEKLDQAISALPKL